MPGKSHCLKNLILSIKTVSDFIKEIKDDRTLLKASAAKVVFYSLAIGETTNLFNTA